MDVGIPIPRDFISSQKDPSISFARVIGGMCCCDGLADAGGADGVGRATRRTVVTASITVLVSDFLLTKLMLAL